VRPRNLTLAVVLGGMAGVLLRAGTAQLLPVHPGAFPWATLLVNVVGCFLLGVVVTRNEHYRAAAHWRPLLGTGLAGGLTTFSTLQVELVNLVDHGDAAVAIAYLAASLVLGLGAVALATSLTHRHASARAAA
jgi:CrcB protein